MVSNKGRNDMRIAQISKGLCAIGMGVLASSAYVERAEARTVAAAIGKPVFASNVSCFNLWSGGVQNVCAGAARTYEASLPVDASGTKSVSVTHQPSSNCHAFANNKDDTSAWVGTTSIVVLASGWRTTTMSGIFVPVGGSLTAGCDVASNDRIQTFEWAP